MTNSGVEIDAAVIEAERNLAQRRHFAAAHLMQDFARLRVRGGVEGRRLECGKAL